jgi:hypothetical protein
MASEELILFMSGNQGLELRTLRVYLKIMKVSSGKIVNNKYPRKK